MSNIFDRTDNTPAASLAETYTVGLNNPEKASEFRKVSLADLASYVGNTSALAAVIGTSASGVDNGSIRVAANVRGSAAVAGNARGAGAVDLQIDRSSATQVASGFASVLIGGTENTSSGQWSTQVGGVNNSAAGDGATSVGGLSNSSGAARSTTIGGSENVTSGTYSSVVGGIGAVAGLWAQEAHASGYLSVAGDCQRFVLTAYRTTANATPTNVFLNGSASRLTLADGYAWAFTATVFGIDSTGLKSGHYIRQGTIANVGGTTALIGTIQTVGTDIETDAGLDVTITADDTNDALDIQVTGLAATNMRWIARIDGLQLKYTT